MTALGAHSRGTSPPTSVRSSSSTSILILLNILISCVPRMPYALAAGRARLRHRNDRPLPEHLPQLHAADRRWRVRVRPQPDPRRSSCCSSSGGRRRPYRGERRRGAAWWLAGALCGARRDRRPGGEGGVEHHMVPGEQVDVLGPLRLTLSHNGGVAFGLAGGGGRVWSLVTAVALGVVAWLFSRDPTRPGMWVAAGLLAGGALGNLIDRVRARPVTDFIELPHWPPFNLADWRSPPGSSCCAHLPARSRARQPG